MPTIAQFDEPLGRPTGVHYDPLTPLLLAQVKTQQTTIERLTATNRRQAATNRRLAATTRRHDRALARLSARLDAR